MTTSVITSDNGVVSGSAGLKTTGGNDGVLALATGTGTTAVTIDASQNVGIGTSSPAEKLSVTNTALTSTTVGANTVAAFRSNATGADTNIKLSDGVTYSALIGQINGNIYFSPNGTRAATIDTSGNLLVGTMTPLASGSTFTTANSARFAIQNTNASPLGLYVNYSTGPNNTGNEYIYCSDTSVRMTVRSNGGIANFSANNVNLSDERTKTDIQDAGGYLAKICAIPVRTFKYKDQTDDLLNLGVIAQEVEAIAPELVDVSGFGETPEDGIPLKAIYQTDLQYALMKCIQEQQALITTLTERITALEAK